MYILRIFFIFLFMCCSLAVKAEPEYNGKVKAFYISKGGTVLLTLDNGSTVPDCSSTPWRFTFAMSDPAAKEWVSMLLTAKASDISIKVGYHPNPAGRCTIEYFYFWQ